MLYQAIKNLYVVRIKIASFQAAERCLEAGLLKQMHGERITAGALTAIPSGAGIKIIAKKSSDRHARN